MHYTFYHTYQNQVIEQSDKNRLIKMGFVRKNNRDEFWKWKI